MQIPLGKLTALPKKPLLDFKGPTFKEKGKEKGEREGRGRKREGKKEESVTVCPQPQREGDVENAGVETSGSERIWKAGSDIMCPVDRTNAALIYRVGHKKPSPYMSANYVFQE